MSEIEHFDNKDTTVVKFEGLQHKTIDQIQEERKFKQQLVNKLLKKGKFGMGSDYGEAGGVKDMVFIEAIETIADAYYLMQGEPVTEIIDRAIDIEINGKMINVPHFAVRVKVPIYDTRSGYLVGWGKGRCSTLESKYRYRSDSLTCPKCGKDTVKINKFKGKKNKFGKVSDHNWYCYKDIGGCGATFMENDENLKNQGAIKVENLNPDDVADTVEYMAEKRAWVKGVLRLTGMRRFLKIPDDLRDKGVEYEKAQDKNNEEKSQKKDDLPPPPQTSAQTETQKANGKKTSLFENKISSEIKENLFKMIKGEMKNPDDWIKKTTGEKIKSIDIDVDEIDDTTYNQIVAEFNKYMG